MKKKPPLQIVPTRKQAELLIEAINFVLLYGRFPTHRECIGISRFKSTSSVAFALDSLRRKGFLKVRMSGSHSLYTIDGIQIKPPSWYRGVCKLYGIAP